MQLNATRQGGFGPQPITYSEIKTYYDLSGYTPEYWEVQVLRLFDKIALEHYATEQEKKDKKSK